MLDKINKILAPQPEAIPSSSIEAGVNREYGRAVAALEMERGTTDTLPVVTWIQARVAEELERRKGVPKPAGKQRVSRAVKNGPLKTDSHGRIQKPNALDWIDRQPEKQSREYDAFAVD